jgi:hypothetical protein
MRTLYILCGICVLFTTLAYAHLLHHHLVHSFADAPHSTLFWIAFIAAFAAGVFSFIGGCVLLKGRR